MLLLVSNACYDITHITTYSKWYFLFKIPTLCTYSIKMYIHFKRNNSMINNLALITILGTNIKS